MPDYSVKVIYKDGTTRELDRLISAHDPAAAARKVLSVPRPFVTDTSKISSFAMTTPRTFQAAQRWLVDPLTFKAIRQGYER